MICNIIDIVDEDLTDTKLKEIIKKIGKHINRALKEELSYEMVIAKLATIAKDGKTYQVEYYNLDIIISVGYRVKSQNDVIFRK